MLVTCHLYGHQSTVAIVVCITTRSSTARICTGISHRGPAALLLSWCQKEDDSGDMHSLLTCCCKAMGFCCVKHVSAMEVWPSVQLQLRTHACQAVRHASCAGV